MAAAHIVTVAETRVPAGHFDVAIVASILAGEEGRSVHLEGTVLLKKLLQSEGLAVVFADAETTHPEVELNALELILPALAFTATAVANGALAKLGEILLTRFGGFLHSWQQRHRPPLQSDAAPGAPGESGAVGGAPPRLFARVGVYEAGGETIRWTELEGSPEDVVAALGKFPA